MSVDFVTDDEILYRRIPRIEGLYVIQEKPTQVMLALTQPA